MRPRYYTTVCNLSGWVCLLTHVSLSSSSLLPPVALSVLSVSSVSVQYDLKSKVGVPMRVSPSNAL